MIRVAVIGCGRIAQGRHIPEFAAHPQVQIAGFYSQNKNRVNALAQQYGVKAYDSVEEILDDETVDAVSVCAPNRFHADYSIRALQKGKHVLCEKPMAMTMEECEAMVRAARASGKKLMIAQNMRFAPQHAAAKKLIEEGTIGKIISFRTSFGHGGPENGAIDPGRGVWFFNKELAGIGAMADLGIHKTDLILYLTGSKIRRVTAVLATLDKKAENDEPISVDDNAFCIFEMTNGAVGTMTASWTYYGQSDNSTVLYGTEGILKINDHPEHPLVLIRKDRSVRYLDVEGRNTSGVIDEFVASIEEDREPLVTADEALHAMRAVLGAVRSAEIGRAVEIPPEASSGI